MTSLKTQFSLKQKTIVCINNSNTFSGVPLVSVIGFTLSTLMLNNLIRDLQKFNTTPFFYADDSLIIVVTILSHGLTGITKNNKHTALLVAKLGL